MAEIRRAQNCLQKSKEDFNELIKHHSGSYTLLRNTEDLWATHTNKKASGAILFNMPSAVVGDGFKFVVDVAQDLELALHGTDTMENPSSGSQSGANLISSTVGSSLEYECTTVGEWALNASSGTWT